MSIMMKKCGILMQSARQPKQAGEHAAGKAETTAAGTARVETAVTGTAAVRKA
jgi:hypothetical protein